MQKNKTLKQLKVMMLRYELKERKEADDEEQVLRTYNSFDDYDFKKLGELIIATRQGDYLKLLHDDHKGDVSSIIANILHNIRRVT